MSRKNDHLRIAAADGIEHTRPNGLDAVRLRHRALPERDLDSVALQCELVGAQLQAPILISAMTGGTEMAAPINARLYDAATEHGVGFALGSGRPLLDDPGLLDTYVPADRDQRPPLLIANLGAAQIDGPRAERLVTLLDADALAIHLNPIQEAIQPEGEPFFAGVVAAIEAAVERLAPLPVLVKEVGFGLSEQDVCSLVEVGVAAVDVAGAGGTNWALIEGRRDPRADELAAAFADWGTATVDALIGAVAVAPELPVIASGGLRDGVDVARCLALGAVAGGLARPFLIAAQADRASAALATTIQQLRIAVWATGAASARELGRSHLTRRPA